MSEKNVLMITLLLVVWPLSSVLGDDFPTSCDGGLYGVEDKGELARFDAELRDALKKEDVERMAALVSYPLRVNSSEQGSISILDPATFQKRFREVFPGPVRSAVLGTSPADVACLAAGILYGAIWIEAVPMDEALAYRVKTVSLPDAAPSEHAPGRVIDFICETSGHRVIVDHGAGEDGAGEDGAGEDGGGDYRYRAWNRPRPLSAKPDAELGGGVWGTEGSGVCRYPRWAFERGDTRYAVRGLGCTDGSEPPGARGALDVEVGGKVVRSAWCR